MKTILFVDDNEAFCRLAKLIFEEEGYHVVTAKDGRQAIEAVEAARPDVAVLDIRMPKTSGFDVAEEMNELTPETPIIFYTGNDETCIADERSHLAACIEKERRLHGTGAGRQPRALAGRPAAGVPRRPAAAAEVGRRIRIVREQVDHRFWVARP